MSFGQTRCERNMSVKVSNRNVVALVVVLVVTVARAAEVPGRVKGDGADAADPTTPRADFKRSLSRDCSKSYTSTCLKLDLVSWVERLSEEDSFQVVPGVSLVRDANSARSNTADLVAELARDFPNDAEARLDAFLLKKVTNYLSSHTLRVRLFDDADQQVASARKKDKGGMGYALAAMLMMKGTLGALMLAALFGVAGKALMTGLLALMLSAIVGLKSLAGGGHKQTTYEIVSKPIYTHAHTHSSSHEEIGHHGGHGGGHGYSGYGRSFDDLTVPLSIQNVSP